MLLSTKLCNEIKKVHPVGLEYYMKNISINGAKRGCSGFIKNTDNARIVYINTEKSSYEPMKEKNLLRTARDLTDYTGGYNQYATDDSIAAAVVRLLTQNI